MRLAQLQSIMPLCKRSAEFLPLIEATFVQFEINNPSRQTAFLAQIAHESSELRFWVEIASGAAYEGRSDLGNRLPGDGARYRGRSPIMLTGRENYRRAGAALELPLEAQPDLAAQPEAGFLIAGWFWRDEKKLNTLADGGPLTFDAITRRINGGLNGKIQRDMYFSRARLALGI